MRATAEIRWFYEGAIPPEVEAWFRGLGPAPEAQPPRTDRYLHPTDAGLNVKLREGRIEVKRRDAPGGPVILAPRVEGTMERWRKWSFAIADPAERPEASPASWLDVGKTRWMRAYGVDAEGRVLPVALADPPPAGCDVELSRVEAAGRVAWSLCLEAYGDEAALSGLLLRTARRLFATDGAPALDRRHSMSYAGWLLEIVRSET